MLVGGDLGFLFSVVLVVVGWIIARKKWHGVAARRAEIRRLMALASEEAARGELEEAFSYKTYTTSLVSEPVAVESATWSRSSSQRKLQYQCEVCLRSTITRCKQCKAVHYCSKTCQVLHWRQGHKDECLSITANQNIDAKLHSCIKKLEQDEYNQSAIGIQEVHATKPVELSSETRDFSNPNFHEVDNVDNKIESSDNSKRNDTNVEASVRSLSDECSSSTISIKTSVASDSSLKDNNTYNMPSISVDMESTESPLSEHCFINHEFRHAASGVLNQLKFGRVDKDEKSESSVFFGSSATYSEEYSPSESSTASSDFWAGTVEHMRSKINAVDEFDDVDSHSSCPPSSSRINIPVELNGSGMKRVTTDDPYSATSMPKKSVVSTESEGLDSSTEAATLSSYSCPGDKSEGHVPSTPVVDARILQSNKPTKHQIDRTNGILDTVKSHRSDSSRFGSKESHLSSNSFTRKPTSHVLQSAESICDNASCSLNSSIYEQSATSGTNLSTRRSGDQLRNSDCIKQGSLGAGSGIKGRFEGSFPYELFVKLYNWNKVELTPRGLLNCGNSCYANAVLQCLMITPPLAAYCLQGLHAKTSATKGWCFTCEFEGLVKKAKEGYNPLSPARIMSQMQYMGSHLGNGREEDAHEFLRFAIDAMQSVCVKEAEVNAPSSLVEETTLLGLTFGGYLQSKIKCMKCGGKSKQNDRIMDLTVEIEGEIGNLEDALTQFTRSEILDGENKYHCGRCKSYEKAKKKLRVLDAPNVLVVGLKRFQVGKYGKLNKSVKFPEILNLAPYMSGTSDKSPIYQLYGVVVHLDVMNAAFSGHYICYIKNNQGKWFKADDSVVQAVELENVLSNDAYILFYARCSPRAPRIIRSLMGSRDPRKAKSLTCRVKPHPVEPWDNTKGEFSGHNSNGCFSAAYPIRHPRTEDSLSECASSYFSEGGSYSTESTNRESLSTTDDNFDQMLVDTDWNRPRHLSVADLCRSSDTRSSTCSFNIRPRMDGDGHRVGAGSKENVLGTKGRRTVLCSSNKECSSVGRCSCAENDSSKLRSNVYLSSSMNRVN